MQAIWRMLLIVGIFLSVMVSETLAEDYPKTTLRYADIAPEKGPNAKIDKFFASELTRRTNGRIQVKVFHGQTIGKPSEIADLLGGGAVQIGNIAFGHNFSQFPMCAFFNTPMIYKDHVMAARLAKLGFQTQAKVQEEMLRANVHPLIFRAMSAYRLISKKPISTLSDFKGLKVRTFGAVNPIMFKALGAVPVTMNYHDAYEGLKRGTLDAMYFSWSASHQFKLHEVAPYVSDVNFGANVGYLTFINLKLWNSWPQNLKDLCQQIARQAEQLSVKIIGEADQKALQAMQADGVKLIHFKEQEQLEKALPDTIVLVQERVAKMGAQYAEPAREYADFLRTELAK